MLCYVILMMMKSLSRFLKVTNHSILSTFVCPTFTQSFAAVENVLISVFFVYHLTSRLLVSCSFGLSPTPDQTPLSLAPKPIANRTCVNFCTRMERGLNSGQTNRSIYPSIFNRLRAIARYWSEIATFCYPLHLTPPLVFPLEFREKV